MKCSVQPGASEATGGDGAAATAGGALPNSAAVAAVGGTLADAVGGTLADAVAMAGGGSCEKSASAPRDGPDDLGGVALFRPGDTRALPL